MRELDAVVVLGCAPDTHAPLLRARARTAASVHAKHPSSTLIASGSHSFRRGARPDLTEAAAMRELVLAEGVPADRILLEERSLDTLGNAFFTKVDYLAPYGLRRVALVTSAFHAARAAFIFTRVLGASYDLTVVPAGDALAPDDLAAARRSEEDLLAMQERWLEGIAPGDDDAFEAFIEHHPEAAYARR